MTGDGGRAVDEATIEDLPGPSPAPSPFASLPLGARAILPAAMDLLAGAQRPLRRASFYIGFIALVLIGPIALLLWFVAVAGGDAAVFAVFDVRGETALDGPIALALLLAVVGYPITVVESRGVAAAVIGAQLEGRPLALGGAVVIARRRFWRIVGASILTGIPLLVGQAMGQAVGEALFGTLEDATIVFALAGGIVAAAPFTYALPGIVLGEVGAVEAVSRSVGLARARPRLAVGVATFGLLSQAVLFLGLGAGLDLVVRGVDLVGPIEGSELALVVGSVVVGGLVFALGTLIFTAEALAAAPQVAAFAALTHYARGLELGRDEAVAAAPWTIRYVGGAMVIGIGLAVLAVVLGLFAVTD